MNCFPVLLFVAALLVCEGRADVRQAYAAADKTVVYDEAKARTDYTLEDPLAFADGRKVATPADWAARRREILDLFAKEMYGAEPPKPEAVVTEVLERGKTCGGLATRTQLRMWFRKDKSGPYVDWLLVRPDREKKPVPVIVQLNYYGNQEVLSDAEVVLPEASLFRRAKAPETYRGNARRSSAVDIVPMEILCARGYAYLTACYEQGAPDPDPLRGDPEDLAYTRLFELWGARDPARTDNITSLGAWAWMLSRGVDYAERDPGLDARRVIVTGCSRLGKAALLAGARDERIAVTVPNQTGGGGAPLSKRVFGENVATEMVHFPHWYCRAYGKYANNEKAMPFDQHLLLACVAPRRLLVEGFTRPWFDCKGEYLACAAAAPVWEFLGKQTMPVGKDRPAPYSTSAVGGDFGYVYRDGGHGISGYDWCWLLDFCAAR